MKKHLNLLFLVLTLSMGFANAQEGIRLSHQPYLQAMTENSVTIVWTSNKPAIGWVELAPDGDDTFYSEERPKYYASEHGFKNVGTVHQVQLKGLKPNTKYRYRVYAQEVLKHQGTDVQYGRVAATDVYSKKPLTFKTNGPTDKFNFAMVNDIHGKNEVLKGLINQVDLKSTDFILFNGDMMSHLISEDEMFAGFLDTATKLFASEVPFYFARGNHETRGPFAFDFPKYFPTNNGKLYYSFTKGDAHFIVLDGGEDKPDSDIEYSGIVDMDNYRTDQAAWLQEEVMKSTYKDAKYKIIICHVPPIGDWHGEREIAKKFLPILNKAGAHIMLSGHWHRHHIAQANDTHNFPVIVNSNVNLMKVDIDKTRARFTIVDANGKQVDEVIVKGK